MARPGMPRGRDKNLGGGSSGVNRRGDGLGTGPVGGGAPGGMGGSGSFGGSSSGNGSGGRGYYGRPGGSFRIPGFSGSYGGGGGSRGGCLSKIITVILVIAVLSFLLRSCRAIFGGSSADEISTVASQQTQPAAPAQTQPALAQSQTQPAPQQTQPVTAPAEGQREKYTKFKNDGSDTATVMVYMCGSDLESRNGMGTADIQEMCRAGLSDKVNLVVYTGGASRWQNNVISSRTNQIYRIRTENGTTGLERLNDNVGDKAMSDPAALTEFIRFAAEKFPSNRYILVLWDHGAGSVSGYAYDEKHPYNGYMKLSGIQKAVEDSGVKFDVVGFDACLMATLETGLMLNGSADYLVASEETEPGTGWYYTNWLSLLSDDPAVDTVTLSRQIIDDFSTASRQQMRGAQTTLSVTDLAELSARVPEKLKAFSTETINAIEGDDYASVAKARANTREFASSERLDQIDVVDFADNLGTASAAQLAAAVKASVKYNRTSSGYERAHGLSIYFPYRKAGQVDDISNTYKEIGMDDEYTACIQKFASMEVTGQAAAGGTGETYQSLFGSIFGEEYGSLFGGGSPMEVVGTGGLTGTGGYGSYNDYYGSGYGQSGSLEMEMVGLLLDTFLSGRSNIAGITADNAKFITEDAVKKNAAYVVENSINRDHLKWVNKNGKKVLAFDDKDWNASAEILLNVFVDDGQGIIDLGLDPLYTWTEDGDLEGTYDGTALSVNGQACAFIFEDENDDGDKYVIHGYIPALINSERSEIEVEFSDEEPNGRIIGYRRVYKDEPGAGQVAKIMSFEDGDAIDFIADYYTYEGTYLDTYMIGDRIRYHGEFTLENLKVDGKAKANYRITDIYGQNYWTPLM